MTGDQWYNLLRLVIILGFVSLILFGVYRLMRGLSRNDKE